MQNHCECADHGCPNPSHLVTSAQFRAAKREGDQRPDYQHCTDDAVCTLFRIDMEDVTGTRFCSPCATDAHSSGLFRSDVSPHD